MSSPLCLGRTNLSIDESEPMMAMLGPISAPRMVEGMMPWSGEDILPKLETETIIIDQLLIRFEPIAVPKVVAITAHEWFSEESSA